MLLTITCRHCHSAASAAVVTTAAANAATAVATAAATAADAMAAASSANAWPSPEVVLPLLAANEEGTLAIKQGASSHPH